MTYNFLIINIIYVAIFIGIIFTLKFIKFEKK